MTEYVFAPPATTSLPIADTDARFPVRRVLCVGRNYDAHRREMGAHDRDPPFFFSKPTDAVVPPGGDVPYPSLTSALHHEVELVVALGGGGRDVPVGSALGLVFGYAVGVDLTRRDIQNEAKAKGQPWEAAKGFDASAPVGVIRRAVAGAIPRGNIRLTVQGAARQQGSLSEMIWSVAEVIHQASRLWCLAPGDLIFTGTPQGVGPLSVGDRVAGEVDGVGIVTFTVAPPIG